MCLMPFGGDPQLHTKGKHGGWSSMKASGVTDEELLRQCVGPILSFWFCCVLLWCGLFLCGTWLTTSLADIPALLTGLLTVH